MTRKLIILAVVAVVAIAAVGGYVLLSGGLPGGSQSLFSLESVTVLGDSRARATWAVFNPSSIIAGLYFVYAVFEADWGVQMDSAFIDDPVIICTDIGPGQTVLVDQEFVIFKGVRRGGVGGVGLYLDPFPQDELERVTDWQSAGGLAEFTDGGCGTGGRILCAVVEGGRAVNSCGDQPTLGHENHNDEHS